MKRQYNPDPVPLREVEYRKIDIDFLKALAETMQSLEDQGISLPESMKTVLAKRKEIKQKFKKE